MVDVVGSVEEARRQERLSQLEVAQSLGVTQGHYSKVVAGRVSLSPALAERMEQWLVESGRQRGGNASTRRMRELATSIRSQCMELMHLATRTTGRRRDR